MHSIIVYGFPMILVSFEALLRNLINVDTFAFVGPTLAATGISFLVPLTKLKELEFETAEGERWVKVSKRDQAFVNLTWLLLFVSLFVWFWVCTLSIQSTPITWLGFPAQIVAGAALYVISIILSTVKEYV
ncbi:hypothetical protein [Thalassotalea euphylliae]|uniref:Uncharacterized protein n=1 Tax=Thalassotalea euphylliae TaxID=1655234 RepID=A0A3E0UHQ1_9GAMM|nr:hypothetical protein [Thalassotalea euphylliae]REL35695.1 hypothetical protein DXX92_10285 [Thalassotalea euphylliae]